MNKLTLVKVGGKIVEDSETLKQLLSDFSKIEGHKVLVHGGGRSATAIAAKNKIRNAVKFNDFIFFGFKFFRIKNLSSSMPNYLFFYWVHVLFNFVSKCIYAQKLI